MSEPNVAADVNAESAESSEVDSQLAEMHSAEGAETTEGAAGQDTVEGAGEEKPEVRKVVPLAALHEERKARQELQRQIAERDRAHAEQMARINQRLEQMANPQQRQAIPDKIEQPVDYLDHRLNDIAAQQQAILQDRQAEHQQRQQAAYVEQLQHRIVGAESVFFKETPDYGDAIKFLDESRVRELQVFGADEGQARQQAIQERIQAALKWAHEGRNPAELAYGFAKARGYQGKAAQQAQQSPADKIAAQQRGTAAARSLGGGGGVTAGKLTAEALANMSDEDFAKVSEAQFRQVMGG